MTLTPEQQDHLRTLLTQELRAAWQSALENGATPAALAELVESRRRAIHDALQGDELPVGGLPVGGLQGREDLGDDPVDGVGVGQPL